MARLCIDCKQPVKSYTAKRCIKCHGVNRRKKIVPRYCLDCSAPLSKWAAKAGTKRCRKCSKRTPEQRNISSVATRQRYEDRPELREAVRQRSSHLQSPEVRAKRKSEASQRKWRLSVRKSRVGWCPEEYLTTYFELRRRAMPKNGKWSVNGVKTHTHIGAHLARQMIEKHIGGPLKQVGMTWPQHQSDMCTLNGKLIRLGSGQKALLSVLLIEKPGVYLTPDELIERMWHPDEEPEYARSIISVLLTKLRQKGIRILRPKAYPRGYRIPENARRDWSGTYVEVGR